jgi:ribonuclease P protein component
MTHRPHALQAADFRRVLSTRPCSRTGHFALYHASDSPQHDGDDLSTPMTLRHDGAVDDQPRLGLVVPKRLARRAATRNLVKRQAKALFAARSAAIAPWAPGDWVIRLSRPFDVKQFCSAASPALRAAVGDELRQLLFTMKLSPTSPGAASAAG